jgi:hypothetical protein
MRRSPLTIASSAGIALALALAALPASADPPPDPKVVEARAMELFTDGVRLLEKGSYAEACAKLAESQKLSPGGGTALNLGYCNEKLGRTATAHALYREALARATAQGRSDRADRARQKVTEIEPRLTRVRIAAPPEVLSLEGLRVEVDGAALADLSQPQAVDPGERVMKLSAKGKRPVEKTVAVAGEGRVVVVAFEMPEGELASAAAPQAASTDAAPTSMSPAGGEPAPPAAEPRPSSGRRTAAIVTLGGGALALGLGAVAGIVASGEHSKSDDLCAGGCTHEGVLAEDSARTWATVSTIGFIAGAVAVGAGVYLFLTSRQRPAAVSTGLSRGLPVFVF